MTKKPQIKKDQPDREQTDAFRKAARELGCTDSEEQFQDALRKIAKSVPKAEKTPRER